MGWLVVANKRHEVGVEVVGECSDGHGELREREAPRGEDKLGLRCRRSIGQVEGNLSASWWSGKGNVVESRQIEVSDEERVGGQELERFSILVALFALLLATYFFRPDNSEQWHPTIYSSVVPHQSCLE
jgi:hypothetical protein